MWFIFAFLGPILWALSTHIDKYLVDKYFRNSDTAVLMVFTAFIGVLMLPFIWFFEPKIFEFSIISIVVIITSGILYMTAMLFYLKAIQSAEASVVGPLFPTTIIFTFILGYLVLGETLTKNSTLGAGLILIGTLVLSLDTSLRFGKVKSKTLFMMLICTFILASSSVIFKYFAIQENFWVTTFWTFIGEAIFGIIILLIPHYFRQFKELLKTNTQALLSINAANELINLGGGLGARFASLLAPVALVSAITSTTTLFTFIFGIILTILLPKIVHEDISKINLLQKAIAAILITAGVILTQI